jgi:hypothetical protein
VFVTSSELLNTSLLFDAIGDIAIQLEVIHFQQEKHFFDVNGKPIETK